MAGTVTPVEVAARRLLDYIDGDASGPGEQLLAHRPYLTALVADLRAALEAETAEPTRVTVADLFGPWQWYGVQVSSGGVAE
jgi:hypothetical protein